MDLSTWLSDTQYLISVDFVQHALIASALLGLLSGVIAPLIVVRQQSFAVHGTAELALMGAAAALLFGLNVGGGAVIGSVVAAILLALLGMKQQDSAVGAVMSFGLGLSVLFIHLYPGRSSTAFSLLTGQIVGVSSSSLWILVAVTVIVVSAVVIFWRPLLFASADPIMAQASGVNVRFIAVAFAVLVGLTTSQSVQIVGALLVMALLITPGAAAVAVTANPVKAVVLAVIFAEVSAVGGLLLSLAPGLPVSVFVTTISFVIYLVCRLIGWLRGRGAQRDEDAYRRRQHDHHPH
ncbi:ABC-type putative Mn/Zn transporter, permease subunit [Corynebacterium glutamicum MB001]|uniref:metal ABC transporter permease n=1 Tax=Corynebacterium glutamicum TaxID=1718 RepID=UPI0000165E55|nr:metal ABC transporter permease [Corynebacterium glutamicum]AGT06347.1 ABC-type putative Mn/Zn transporter, permease subunit [Corynebacterium glutamicum MB001]AIK86049.1 helicase [Corynebacterium glutamicum]AIK88832.1 helicase [Corynebacterium glutamicum]ARV66153.1 ABC transporter permease [Corynebacterium glutamicum]ASW14946.1 ABC-type putative Mn/Zn transporter, permease subunit [Corynebacterium glutamicum]